MTRLGSPPQQHRLPASRRLRCLHTDVSAAIPMDSPAAASIVSTLISILYAIDDSHASIANHANGNATGRDAITSSTSSFDSTYMMCGLRHARSFLGPQ